MSGELRETAVAEDGEVMSVEHRAYPVIGEQYHPESILPPDGKKLMENFFRYVEVYQDGNRRTD